MARQFLVALAAGVPFIDPILMRGSESACNSFPPHHQFMLSDAFVEPIFFVTGECWVAYACGVGGAGFTGVCGVGGTGATDCSCCVGSVGGDFAEEFCNFVILGGNGSGESLKDNVAIFCRQGQGLKTTIKLIHDGLGRSPESSPCGFSG